MVVEQFSLDGKAALVIGASNPLGRAAAVALAEAGANVGVTTTTRSQREEVLANSCANEIWALNRKGLRRRRSTPPTSQMSRRSSSGRSRSLGALDILVNAPDLHFAKPLSDIIPPSGAASSTSNLTAVFLACRAAAREVMLRQDCGRIINIASVLGERGLANGSAYCAAQAGVLNFTRALALEWARSGVTVNAIGAGWTEGMGFITDEGMRPQLERYLPYKRLGKPDEIAGAVVYLASDVAEYLTGQVIWIEGGALSHV